MSKKTTLILRILLGILLVVFGSNKFIDFLPHFDFSNPYAAYLFNAFKNSYILKTVGFIETIIGLLFIVNKAVPFSLIVLAPISINIILFHLTLDPINIGPGLFVFFVNIFLIYRYWSHYKSLF